MFAALSWTKANATLSNLTSFTAETPAHDQPNECLCVGFSTRPPANLPRPRGRNRHSLPARGEGWGGGAMFKSLRIGTYQSLEQSLQLPASYRFPPLRERNRARVRFPLLAGGTLRRGASIALVFVNCVPAIGLPQASAACVDIAARVQEDIDSARFVASLPPRLRAAVELRLNQSVIAEWGASAASATAATARG